MYMYLYENEVGVKRAYSNATDENSFLEEIKLLDLEGYLITYRRAFFKVPQRKIFSSKERVIFYNSLYSYLNAGIKMDEALGFLKKQFIKKTQHKFLDELIAGIDGGVKLSVLFSGFNDFKNMELTILRVGEESGDIPGSLQNLCDFLEGDYKREQKKITMLVYPLLFTLVAYGVSVYAIKGVVPGLLTMINIETVPNYTKTILEASKKLNKVSIQTFIAMYFVGMFLIFKAKDVLKALLFKVMMQFRFFRDILLQSYNYEFISYFNVMIKSGIPLSKIFHILETGATEPFASEYQKIREDVESGIKISESMSDKYFIPLVKGGIMSGERSGDIPSSTEKVKEFLKGEVDSNQERLMSVIPVILLIFMAVFVVGFAMVFYFPTITNLKDF